MGHNQANVGRDHWATSLGDGGGSAATGADAVLGAVELTMPGMEEGLGAAMPQLDSVVVDRCASAVQADPGRTET